MMGREILFLDLPAMLTAGANDGRKLLISRLELQGCFRVRE